MTEGNPVWRHARALGSGVRGELRHIVHDRPRSVATKLGISLWIGLAYLGFLRVFHWDDQQEYLPYPAMFGGVWLPVLMIVASAAAMWLLLTVLAVSLADQPRVRRSLIRELVDYREARTAARNPVSDLEVHGA